ncbi:MAG: HAMP domain-containing sensor histidine kinase, partial [Acidobacteriota bacterium]
RPKIETVLVDGEHRSMAPPIAMSHDERDLEIRYTALGFREPRRLRFRYRMAPTETVWNDVGARRTAYFSRLPPGEHVFELSVGTAAGRWQEPVSIAFEIRPAFHQTGLFAGLASIVLVALGLFLSRFLYLQRHTWALRRMQKEITDKNAELAAQNTELERFAQSVAHDLKNPLHTIQGFLDLLEMDLDAGRSEAIESGIEQIRDGAGALDQRLDALLELSRAGRVVGEPRDVDLAEVLARTVRHLGAAIQECGVVVDIDHLARAPKALGDPERLAVVFQNLIENAIKYSGDVAEPRIEVHARQRGDRVRCRVRDNGIGIAPEHLGEVFGLFRQLDPQAEGSGIGLALVRRVVEAHGGKIRVRSEGVGQGTSFVFDLPAAEPAIGA